jgi:hypothetical protein
MEGVALGHRHAVATDLVAVAELVGPDEVADGIAETLSLPLQRLPRLSSLAD